MPSVEMMNKECCKTIVEDIKNVKNHDIAIQFNWISPKPLQLIDTKELIHQHTQQITTVALKTQIGEGKSNSIIIYCSKLTKYKMKSRFGIPIKLVESSKTVVYGFIHSFEKQHSNASKTKIREKKTNEQKVISRIPNSIKNICCMFYDCFIEIPPNEASAFTILFAIFDLQHVLSIKGWTLL
eukprot:62249_1